MLSLAGLKSWEWVEVTAYFTATKTGAMRVLAQAYDISTAGCEIRWDVISIKEVLSHSNTRYTLPEECNGVYLAVLNGEPIWYGQEKDGWLYDEEN